MASSARIHLPTRRPSHTETLEVSGQVFTATIGFDPESGQPRELFLNGGKEGSQVDAMLSDAATIISVALQFGVPAAALAKSVGRAPNLSTMPGSTDQLIAGNHAASPIGAAVDLLCSVEPEI
jgi:hypothetical protein